MRPVPTRTCVACRTAREKRALVRIVRTPDGSVVVDPTGKRSGRGAYLCPGPDCLRLAERRGSLARALGVPIPKEVVAGLATLMAGPQAADAAGGSGADDRESQPMNGGQRGTK